MQTGRNDPCPCGSGKKFKRCCGAASSAHPTPRNDLADWFAQGQRAHHEGRLGDAQHLYQNILQADPLHADALHYLGMAAFQQGDVERARTLVARSLTIKPDDADYWSNQGVICETTRDPLGAEKAYREAARLDPKRALTWFNLGNALRRLDRYSDAAKAFLEAIRLRPIEPDPWMNLGNVYLLQDPPNLDEGLRCFERFTRLQPKRGEGYNSLGVAYVHLNHLQEALSAFQQAVKLTPGLANAWFNLAHLHLLRDDAEAALQAYQQAVALSPDTADFYAMLAHTLRIKGDFTAALTFFEKLHERDPSDLGALAALIEDRRFPDSHDPLLLRARHSLDHAADDKDGVVELCFTLGKALDRLNAFDEAFAYYARGNRLVRKDHPFDRETHRRYVDRLIRTYDHAGLERLKPWGNPSDKPIYIVGMPRSGTTLTEQIIASHARVAGGGERGFWHLAENRLDSGIWKLDAQGMREIAQEALADLAFVRGSEQASHVTDKMPGNFVRVGLIHAHFPNARILHVRRHPVDNCLSIFFQNFAGEHPYAYDLEDLAFYHREYERLMAHWRAVMPADRYFEFDYEELVADQEGMSRKLIEFCGLDWDEACLRYYENERAVQTASIWQVRQKMYSTSVERWRNYEAHIGPLLSLLKPA